MLRGCIVSGADGCRTSQSPEPMPEAEPESGGLQSVETESINISWIFHG